MAIDVNDLRTEVNATTNDDVALTNCVAVAAALLAEYVSDPTLVPEVIYDKAWLAVGVELFNQRQAPNGILMVQDYGPDGSPSSLPVRVSADPMRPAYPLLKMFLGTGIA